jgi:hypothetical protein
MKKLPFLSLIIFTLFVSCKDDKYVQLRFGPTLVDKTDTIGWSWDSIVYTTVYYSDENDFKIIEDLNNPDIFRYSKNMDVRKDYLSLMAGHVYVIKKFDMIGKSGKVLFYIPYEGQPGSNKIILKLPILIPMNNSKSLSIGIVRYIK